MPPASRASGSPSSCRRSRTRYPAYRSALVIAGSDKRGTIYGIYDLSEQIGVSPWYWWADVTPDRKNALYIKAGKYQQGEPSVKYRGIFLNDEKPDLDVLGAGEVRRTPDSGQPSRHRRQLQQRVLRQAVRGDSSAEGNYLWPAMWNNAFAEDDPDNPRLADEYGIVMGTSHQEPMLRAQKEWDWHLRQQHGNWNFATHRGCARRILARRDPAAQGLREHLHDRTAGRKRHGDGAGVRPKACACWSKIVDFAAQDARRGSQSRRDQGPAGLDAL